MPVDVKRLARAVGLTVRGGYFAHEGRITDDVIEVPEQDSRTAQRFAIAHEIGHRRLRHQIAGDKIEPEANAFASELLIPRPRLKRAVDAGLTVDELRRLFDVSPQAVHWALEDARLLGRVKA